MTDAALQGIALQALNMARIDFERDKFNFLLGFYHEGEGLHRARKVEAEVVARLGEDWLNHGNTKDIGFGILRFAASASPPDALVLVTAVNGYKPTEKFGTLPMERQKAIVQGDMPGVRKAVREGLLRREDVMIAWAQTPERVCQYTQRMPFDSEPPQVAFFGQDDFEGRVKLFGAAPAKTMDMLRTIISSETEDGFRMGQQVRVYPHGDQSQAATGTILIISKNQRSIAVAFGDKPPFVNLTRDGVFVHQSAGVVMMATREAIEGKPWGPWVEMTGGGHYEIEPVPDAHPN